VAKEIGESGDAAIRSVRVLVIEHARLRQDHVGVDERDAARR
jgi:hypothetical protein